MAETTSSSSTTPFIVAAGIITLLLILAAAFYFTDAGQDLSQWVAEKYFKAEAKATEKALEKAGSEKAEGFLYVISYSCFISPTTSDKQSLRRIAMVSQKLLAEDVGFLNWKRRKKLLR